jgi:hypothetical protein
VQFPDGARLTYCLAESAPVQQLYDFVACQEKVRARPAPPSGPGPRPIRLFTPVGGFFLPTQVGPEFTLFTGHPKVALADRAASVGAAGLAPKALVLVQDLAA